MLHSRKQKNTKKKERGRFHQLKVASGSDDQRKIKNLMFNNIIYEIEKKINTYKKELFSSFFFD